MKLHTFMVDWQNNFLAGKISLSLPTSLRWQRLRTIIRYKYEAKRTGQEVILIALFVYRLSFKVFEQIPTPWAALPRHCCHCKCSQRQTVEQNWCDQRLLGDLPACLFPFCGVWRTQHREKCCHTTAIITSISGNTDCSSGCLPFTSVKFYF